jgi:hypothetical protein
MMMVMATIEQNSSTGICQKFHDFYWLLFNPKMSLVCVFYPLTMNDVPYPDWLDRLNISKYFSPWTAKRLGAILL